jgi:hypothetical protein
MTLLEQPVQLEGLGIAELMTLRVKPLPPTPKELAYWRSLSNQATRGPWEWAEDKWNARMKKRSRSRYVHLLQGPLHGGIVFERGTDEYDHHQVMHLRWSEVKGGWLFGVSPLPQDREFIAEARTALPRLLDYVESLEKEVVRLQRAGSNP